MGGENNIPKIMDVEKKSTDNLTRQSAVKESAVQARIRFVYKKQANLFLQSRIVILVKNNLKVKTYFK